LGQTGELVGFGVAGVVTGVGQRVADGVLVERAAIGKPLPAAVNDSTSPS
jgi:hypothetical protein